jgi:hypothetical protein
VDVLEDLLEDLPVAFIGLSGFWLQVTKVAAVAAITYVFQVSAAAEDAAVSAKDDGANIAIPRELKTCSSEVLRCLDVERVETFAARDRQDAYGSFALDSDVLP